MPHAALRIPRKKTPFRTGSRLPLIACYLAFRLVIPNTHNQSSVLLPTASPTIRTSIQVEHAIDGSLEILREAFWLLPRTRGEILL